MLRKFSSANDYMIKSSWNSIILDGSIPKGEIERMMDNSYMLVVNDQERSAINSAVFISQLSLNRKQ